MSVDMYLAASQKQAASTSKMVRQQITAYEAVQKAINEFTMNIPLLTGKAYDSAKSYFAQVLYPLAKGGMLLSEAVEKAVKKLPEEYLANVDSGDLKQSELEEDIRQLTQLINEAYEIRNMFQSEKMPTANKQLHLTSNEMVIELYIHIKKELEEKLRKLLHFNAISPMIFAEIKSLQQAVDQGLAQTKNAWNEQPAPSRFPVKKGNHHSRQVASQAGHSPWG